MFLVPDNAQSRHNRNLLSDRESQFRDQMWERIYKPAGKLRLQLKRSSGEFYRSLETLNGKSVRTQSPGNSQPLYFLRKSMTNSKYSPNLFKVNAKF